jgi:hypothetical protein
LLGGVDRKVPLRSSGPMKEDDTFESESGNAPIGAFTVDNVIFYG